MAVYSADLLNSRIDLSDVLSWRIAQTPRFIRLFRTPRATGLRGQGRPAPRVATNQEHFWLEGVYAPKTKSFTACSYGGGAATFTVADSNGWKAGDLFHVLGDSRVWTITEAGTAAIKAAVAAANGSESDPTELSSGVLVFDSRPIQEGSSQGEDFFMQSHTESNFTQIFRGDVELTGTASAIQVAGSENHVATQLQYATDAIIRRMNAALVFGVKTRRTASVPGSLGGLYYFGRQSDGLGRPQSGSPALTMGKINQAAQDVLDAGCIPDAVICGSGQAQVISTFMASQVQVGQDSRTAGRYVDTFITSAGGATLKVIVEPSIPDTDVWVCDTRGFALLPLASRGLHTEPASAPGVDARKAMILGEYTAEFKNAKQALCCISGLKASNLVLA